MTSMLLVDRPAGVIPNLGSGTIGGFPPSILEQSGRQWLVRCLRCHIAGTTESTIGQAIEWFNRHHLCEADMATQAAAKCRRKVTNKAHYRDNYTCRCDELDTLHGEWFAQAILIEAETAKLHDLARQMWMIG